MALLQRSSWRYLLRHPWLLVLSIVGVALGVAVVVAVDLANESARRAFALSMDRPHRQGHPPPPWQSRWVP